MNMYNMRVNVFIKVQKHKKTPTLLFLSNNLRTIPLVTSSLIYDVIKKVLAGP